jgi:hypothetical protein
MAAGRESLDLSGVWRIAFDPEDVGRRDGWFDAETIRAHATREIIVPSCWEEIEQDYEGVAWYTRSFDVPGSFRHQTVRLRFHAANYRAEVWLNGEMVDYHDGGYTPFEFDVTGIVRPGAENLIIVRVVGPLITRDVVIDGIGMNETPHWRGAIAGGLWQPVELISTAQDYVRDVFVAPDIHADAITVDLALENAGTWSHTGALRLTVHDVGVVSGTPAKDGSASSEAPPSATVEIPVVLVPGTNPLTAELTLEDPSLWSPDDPHLCVLEAKLETSDGQSDLVTTRFGMREFTVENGRFCLNGEPLYLKALFWECLYPNTLANPPDPAMVRRELVLAKEMGANLLRPWRKPLQPWIMDMADEMGILLVGAVPVECMDHWPEVSPQLATRVAIEVRESVLRDRNHPSLVWWELFNEILRPELGRLKHRMALLARELDPSRLIADESGGWWGGAHLYLPYSSEPTPFNELHRYLRAPVDDRVYEALRTMGAPEAPGWRGVSEDEDAPSFLSEVGFGSLSDLSKDVQRYEAEGNPITPDAGYHKALLLSLEAAMEEQGLYEVFGDVSTLCAASQAVQAEGNKLQVEAVRLNPHIDGFAVHAFTDGDWVYGAGVLDIWRNPKPVYHALKEAYGPLYLALRVHPANVVTGEDARLTVTAVNDLGPVAGDLSIGVVGSRSDGEGGLTLVDARPIEIGRGIVPLLETTLSTDGLDGTAAVKARLVSGGSLVAENTFVFLVVDPQALRQTWSQARTRWATIDPAGVLNGPVFDDGTPLKHPVVVGCEDAPDGRTLVQFERLFERVRAGGVAVFLKPPVHRDERLLGALNGFWEAGAIPAEENALVASGLFPLELHSRMATGMWVPVNHVVKDHPIFAGLPTNTMMGHVYQNLCPVETLVGVEGETIVGALSCEWNKAPRTYLGYHEFWWGSSLVVVPYGEGKLMLSTLRIVEHLGRDPVVDLVFRQMVDYAAELVTAA